VFAAILDAERGGRYRLRPAVPGWTTKQLYFPDSNVLITRFLTPEGVGEVEDLMPLAQTGHGSHRQRLIRRVVAVRGRMHFELECAPRFDYGRERHTLERHEHGAILRAPSCTLALETEMPIETRDGDVHASFSLAREESATFILEHVDGPYEHGHSPEETRQLFEATVALWRRWLSQSRYGSRTASKTAEPESPGRSRSSTESTGAPSCPRKSSITSRATAARPRSASATPRRASCSSTSTAT
jgi:GH15 family glucan-1,4-alpha-glucosidase